MLLEYRAEPPLIRTRQLRDLFTVPKEEKSRHRAHIVLHGEFGLVVDIDLPHVNGELGREGFEDRSDALAWAAP